MLKYHITEFCLLQVFFSFSELFFILGKKARFYNSHHIRTCCFYGFAEADFGHKENRLS